MRRWASRAALPRCVAAAGVLAWLAVAGLGSPALRGADGEQRFRGRPLAEALELLRGEGLPVIYSSDLVRPELRVGEEPAAGDRQAILEAMLEPHQLTVRAGPGGSLLVVRRPPYGLELTMLEPRTGQVAAGEVAVEVTVAGEESVAWVDFSVNGHPALRLHGPPFRATVPLREDAATWRVAAVAHGQRGSSARAEATVRSLVVREALEVALRHLALTITRPPANGRALALEDLRVLEDGEPAEVVSLEPYSAPVSAVILVDTSGSMGGGHLEEACRATRGFLAGLGPRDEAMLLLFSDRVRAVSPFGAEPASLYAACAAAHPAGGTALTDHLYLAMRMLDGRDGRPVVVLLSDGVDVLSALRMEELRWKVERSDALLYWLRPGGPAGTSRGFTSAWRDEAANRGELEALEQAVRESGGRVLTAVESASLATAITSVLAELRQQLILGYHPPPGAEAGAPRRVEVQTSVPRVRLRYRALHRGG